MRLDPVTIVLALVIGALVMLAGADAVLTGNHTRQQLCDETVGECDCSRTSVPMSGPAAEDGRGAR